MRGRRGDEEEGKEERGGVVGFGCEALWEEEEACGFRGFWRGDCAAWRELGGG